MLWELHEDVSDILVSKTAITMSDIKIDENILKYINRLSDYFFVMARYVCKKSGSEDCFQKNHV
jgi:cob(I)alamin adenosyltransferase